MFLKSITINNYKSIQKATVGFENGLNIIIGKNGAGKSNLLQFIDQAVSYLTIGGRHSKDINYEFQFSICYDENPFDELIVYLKRDKGISNGEIEYSSEIKISKKKEGQIISEVKTVIIKEKDVIDRSNSDKLNELLHEIDSLQNFHKVFVSFEMPDNPYWLDKPNKFEIDYVLFPMAEAENSYDGFVLIHELNYMVVVDMTKQKSVEFEDIESDNVKKIFTKIFDDFNEKYQLNYNLSKFTPIQEIRLNPNINIYNVDNKILVQNLLIDFKVNDKWIPWSYLSDGSKRLFYLITQCLSIEDGLVLIEEPELGIHPHQLFHLMNFLKEQSEEKQIIISTHSPMVLDILRPDELNRITIAKIEHNGSQFYKLNDRQIALAKEYMQDVADLSDYWVHSDLENNYAETND